MFPEPHFIDTNGIRMAVFEQGEGEPVIVSRAEDVLISPEHIEGMKPFVPDLEIHMLGCGHWTQQEKPGEVNQILVDWLTP
jgi:pimeloyl-ACP methyl ester carboxylesterase